MWRSLLLQNHGDCVWDHQSQIRIPHKFPWSQYSQLRSRHSSQAVWQACCHCIKLCWKICDWSLSVPMGLQKHWTHKSMFFVYHLCKRPFKHREAQRWSLSQLQFHVCKRLLCFCGPRNLVTWPQPFPCCQGSQGLFKKCIIWNKRSTICTHSQEW